MKDNIIKTNEDHVVIPDECGDSMWDAVLSQEFGACDKKNISKNAVSLLNNIEKVETTTKAE